VTRMALGWRRTTVHGETYYWSNGSGDGSRTFMGFNPARHVAVVALADAASDSGLDDIARRVLDPQQVVDLKVLPWREAISLPEAAFNRVVGRYAAPPDDHLEISRGATGLIVTAAQAQFVIKPLSQTRYFLPGDDLFIDFENAGSGPASALVLHQEGKSFIYKRVP
jgi:serine-type D-Ala-D-Ala carboxypeptidase/endopeptidase